MSDSNSYYKKPKMKNKLVIDKNHTSFKKIKEMK